MNKKIVKIKSSINNFCTNNKLLLFGISMLFLFLIYRLMVTKEQTLIANILLIIMYNVFVFFPLRKLLRYGPKIKNFFQDIRDGKVENITDYIRDLKFIKLNLFRTLINLVLIIMYFGGVYCLIVVFSILIVIIAYFSKAAAFSQVFIVTFILFLSIFISFSILAYFLIRYSIVYVIHRFDLITYFVKELMKQRKQIDYYKIFNQFLLHIKSTIKWLLFRKRHKIALKFSITYFNTILQFPHIKFKTKKEIINDFLNIITKKGYDYQEIILWIDRSNDKIKSLYPKEYKGMSQFLSSLHNIKEFKLFEYLKKEDAGILSSAKIVSSKLFFSNNQIFYWFLAIVVILITMLLSYLITGDPFTVLRWVYGLFNYVRGKITA